MTIQPGTALDLTSAQDRRRAVREAIIATWEAGAALHRTIVAGEPTPAINTAAAAFDTAISQIEPVSDEVGDAIQGVFGRGWDPTDTQLTAAAMAIKIAHAASQIEPVPADFSDLDWDTFFEAVRCHWQAVWHVRDQQVGRLIRRYPHVGHVDWLQRIEAYIGAGIPTGVRI